MLYLIEDRDYLKIGYAKNIKDRMSNYKLHNCYAKLLSSKEGSMINEKELHELCKEWHYQGEWFYNVPEVKQIFEEYDSFDESKYIWFKKIVTERYISLRKNKTLPSLSNKDYTKIKNLFKEIVPKNLNSWIFAFKEQEELYKVVSFFNGSIEKFPDIRFDFKIFPNVNVHTLNYLEQMLIKYGECLDSSRELLDELQDLKDTKRKRSLTLDEEHRYWNLIWQIDEYKLEIKQWDVKNKYIKKCIIASEKNRNENIDI